MKQQQQQYQLNGNNEITGIKVTVMDNGVKDKEFIVPVLDARRSESERQTIQMQIKQNNKQRGSKFMKPSYSVIGKCYQ